MDGPNSYAQKIECHGWTKFFLHVLNIYCVWEGSDRKQPKEPRASLMIVEERREILTSWKKGRTLNEVKLRENKYKEHQMAGVGQED